MSQMGVYGTTGQITGIPKNVFGQLLLTTTTAASFKVGEIVTGGTSGATAKVSGITANNTLRLKAIKGVGSMTAFADGETITGNQSAATAVVGTAGFKLNNVVHGVTTDTISLNTAGVNQVRSWEIEPIVAIKNALAKSGG